MRGGTISGNIAENAGGGVYINSGTFTPAGTISGNAAPTDPQIGAKNSGSIPIYTVTVDSQIEGGTVTADKPTAKYGEAVTLTVTPDEDFLLRSLTVTDEENRNVPVAGNVFIMPSSDVFVTAEFEERFYYTVEISDDFDTDKGRLEINGNVSDYVLAGDPVTVTGVPYDSEAFVTSWTVLYEDEFSHEYSHAVTNIAHPSLNSITFPMPNARVRVSATFSGHDDLFVFVRDAVGGTVIADKTVIDKYDYENRTVSLQIQPDNGYAYVPGSLCVTEANDFTGEETDITERLETVTENSEYTLEVWDNSVYVSAPLKSRLSSRNTAS